MPDVRNMMAEALAADPTAPWRGIGGGRILSLPSLRALAVVAGFTWALLAPPDYSASPALWLTLLAFAAYSAVITAALWRWPARVLAWNFPILAIDLAFALVLIGLSGGARSSLFLALFVIASLQAYYHGLVRGTAVAAAAALGYLAVTWPTIQEAWTANMALQIVMLVGAAVAAGLLGQLEEAERDKVRRLTAETQHLERSARQAEKLAALGTLAAGLAHELNNPIGVISSRIEIMLLDAESRPLPPDVTADLTVLHRHAQRVARIAHGLLSFARQAPGERGPVDLNHLVEDTLLLVEKQLAKDHIAVKCSLAPDVPPVLGDANSLQQVLLNLLMNAREALGGRGEVSVETVAPVEQPGAARLIVRDSGPGISPEALPRIFDPFFTTKAEGTGLGLSISYGIVRDHQGTIDVQSQAGEGTTFILTFPPMAQGAGA
jgi:signal transduction histidine kinase